MDSDLPFRISVLLFIRDEAGRLLLIERRKAPNLGCWSPVGGKLEMARGESPYECALREMQEETGLVATEKDLHLFAMIAEKGYEGSGHWLMFLFDCHKPLMALPPEIDEGPMAFFTREEVDELKVPPSDRHLIWPNYDRHRTGFIALRADCAPETDLQIVVEEKHELIHSRQP